MPLAYAEDFHGIGFDNFLLADKLNETSGNVGAIEYGSSGWDDYNGGATYNSNGYVQCSGEENGEKAQFYPVDSSQDVTCSLRIKNPNTGFRVLLYSSLNDILINSGVDDGSNFRYRANPTWESLCSRSTSKWYNYYIYYNGVSDSWNLRVEYANGTVCGEAKNIDPSYGTSGTPSKLAFYSANSPSASLYVSNVTCINGTIDNIKELFDKKPDFYDDFEDENINLSKWFEVNNGFSYVDESFGRLSASYYGWGPKVLSHKNFSRLDDIVFTFQAKGTEYGLIGLSDSETYLTTNPDNYLTYGFYIANNNAVKIKECGGIQTDTGYTYQYNSWYDFKIDVNLDSGAKYYYKPISSNEWINVHNSSCCTNDTLKVQISPTNNGIEYDDLMVTSGGISNCLDNDGDGAGFGGDCLLGYDCNDNDPNIHPPRNNATYTVSKEFCAGTYYLPDGIYFGDYHVTFKDNGNVTFV